MINFIINVIIIATIGGILVEAICGLSSWQGKRYRRKYQKLVKKVREEI